MARFPACHQSSPNEMLQQNEMKGYTLRLHTHSHMLSIPLLLKLRRLVVYCIGLERWG